MLINDVVMRILSEMNVRVLNLFLKKMILEKIGGYNLELYENLVSFKCLHFKMHILGWIYHLRGLLFESHY